MDFQLIKKRFPWIKINEPLKNHCTFGIGGPADFFYELTNVEELPELIKFADENHIPHFVFAAGANILFLDKGFRGLVIQNLSSNIRVDNETITADSGALLKEIIEKGMEAGLTGLEPLFGIPGTIGGAIFGNAGVPGTEIADFVVKVSCFNIEEGIRVYTKDEMDFLYRSSRIKKQGKDLILGVTLKLKKGNKKKSKKQIDGMVEARATKHPLGKTCGSLFKNPLPDKPAGMLIDQAGLKGLRIGGAQISEKHGNFFLNLGNATAKDVLELAKIAKEKVREKFGIALEEEVRIIGE